MSAKPYPDAVSVTPHDTNENRYAELYVYDAEGGGTVAIEPASGGASVTFTVGVGVTRIEVSTVRVLDSGTSGVDSIIGLR